MKNSVFLLFFFCVGIGNLTAQNYYYPPNFGDEWATKSTGSMGWCAAEVDSLYAFLEEKNTKAFIVLHEGKIVIEQYFDGHDQNASWYWASAGKSLVSTLVGIAQFNNLLDIDDPVSDYLGQGWTSATPEQEAAITLRHQLSMSTGLNDITLTPNCLTPDCLTFLQAPDTRWAYYNAPYRLLQDVLSSTTNQNITLFTYNQLGIEIGMGGAWIDYVFFSNARSMARFGLFILSEGDWDGTTILGDASYFNEMISSSQDFNPSYGYLWWLNGQEEYMLPVPGLQITQYQDLVPNAPSDAFAALGKNDQKCYVVPSEDLVVIRMGNKADEESNAVTAFDNELWAYLNNLVCTSTQLTIKEDQIQLVPNPSYGQFSITGLAIQKVDIYDSQGRRIRSTRQTEIDLSNSPTGVYWVHCYLENGQILPKKLVLING